MLGDYGLGTNYYHFEPKLNHLAAMRPDPINGEIGVGAAGRSQFPLNEAAGIVLLEPLPDDRLIEACNDDNWMPPRGPIAAVVAWLRVPLWRSRTLPG